MQLTLTVAHLRPIGFAIGFAAILGAGGFELHRSRVALEALRADVERPPPSAPAKPEAAVCHKEVSHLDHDVDLGVPAPCPDAADGTCVMVQGHPMPIGQADARCRAGRL